MLPEGCGQNFKPLYASDVALAACNFGMLHPASPQLVRMRSVWGTLIAAAVTNNHRIACFCMSSGCHATPPNIDAATQMSHMLHVAEAQGFQDELRGGPPLPAPAARLSRGVPAAGRGPGRISCSTNRCRLLSLCAAHAVLPTPRPSGTNAPRVVLRDAERWDAWTVTPRYRARCSLNCSSTYREGWEACRAGKPSRTVEQRELCATHSPVYSSCRGCAAGGGHGRADVQAAVN